MTRTQSGPSLDALSLDLFKLVVAKTQAWKWADFDLKGGERVQGPAHWSQLAVEIAARFYLRSRVSPNQQKIDERSLQHLLARIACGVTSARVRFGGLDLANAETTALGLFQDLFEQKFAFNSPVWMNLGLKLTLGSTVTQEQSGVARGRYFVWNHEQQNTEPTRDVFSRPQLSACFIQSVQDSLESVFSTLESEARIFKHGSGSGSNFSHIRSRGEPLSFGGESPGLIRFLDIFDRAAGAMKSGGSARRAAKMVVVDCDHPDIFEFIGWKRKEEAKAKALVSAGFAGGIDGDAYQSVSGQNSNNSVRLTDEVLEKAERGEDLNLIRRFDGQVAKSVSARALIAEIAKAAWECADPGVQFQGTIERNNPISNEEQIRGSNPCAEFVFLDDTACNLASLNLLKYFRFESAEWDVSGFAHSIESLVQAQDAMVDLASYPTSEIAEKSQMYRPIGIGYTNLGALLMQAGLSYDSEEARLFCGVITSLMAAQAHLTSATLAETNGPFPRYSQNKMRVVEVVQSRVSAHFDLAERIQQWTDKQVETVETTVRVKPLLQQLATVASKTWSQALAKIKASGLRNAQLTLIAPTGTISFVMDCETTGIEPEFGLVKTKALSGGGRIVSVSKTFHQALVRMGLSEDSIEWVTRHLEAGLPLSEVVSRLRESGNTDAAKKLENEKNVFACAQDLSPEAHLQMMAAAQPFLCGAISKTVNLPSHSTAREIESLIFTAWKLGLKSVSFYRDGSKQSQPLNHGKIEDDLPGDLNSCSVCD